MDGQIFVPQNSIPGASPADLSHAGDTGDILESFRKALSTRQQMEDLKSNEAYTKAIKDNTDKNTGVLNMAGVYKELKDNKDYTLNADHYTPTSEEIAARNENLAQLFKNDNSRVDALLKTGSISQDVANKLKGLNQNGLALYGLSQDEAPSGMDAYAQTGLATSQKRYETDIGGQKLFGYYPAIASPGNKIHFNQSARKTLTPGEVSQATTPITIQQTTPEGLETKQEQGNVTPYGFRNYDHSKVIAISNATDNRLTNQIAQEYADSIPNLRKAEQQESNLSEAANAIFHGEGKANMSPIAKAFGVVGLAPGSTAQRDAIAKSMASTIQSYGGETDKERVNRALASGINSQNPEIMQLATFLRRGQNMGDVLLNNFYVNNRTNPKKIEYATEMMKKYGNHAPDLAFIHLLAQEAAKNPHLYKKDVDVMKEYMPNKLNELWNKRDIYKQAVKDGAIIHGYANSPIFNTKVKND